MRAVLALDGEDYKKHSAVIVRFTLNYLKTDILPRSYGALISNASLIRNRSDYEDFYICSIDDTKRLIDGQFLSFRTKKVQNHNDFGLSWSGWRDLNSGISLKSGDNIQNIVIICTDI
uniref:Uncharacterized protein n=1 Tax=uncultured bacterium Ad_113_I18_contig2 TaxID=1489298 RepID=A0A0B4N137_9BACT|nr:putative uncharacterized protein [uncultured bacterium Ad_113_I18_contig2]